MKKSRIFLALAGLALIFAGCSDISTGGGDSSVSSGYSTGTSGAKSLTLSVTSDDQLLTFTSSAGRTILPQAVDASGNAVKFYLGYIDSLSTTTAEKLYTGTGTTPVEIDFDASSATTGTINLSFSVSVYKFTLYCVKASQSITSLANAQQYAMFVGYANADLRYADAITFYMTANTNSTAKGTVSLKLYTSNEKSTATTDLWKVPAGYTVTAGIYSKVNDTLMYGASGGNTSPAEILAPSTTGTAIAGTEFSATSVVPGTYNFVVTFTTTRNSTTVNYYYSDEIIILANQDTEGNVFIPDILEKEPDAPSGFIVAYADALTPDDTYYYGQFAWADNSNNERSFEIDLVKVNDNADNTQGATPSYKLAALPTSDDTWDSILSSTYGAASNVVTYKWDDYQNSELNANPGVYSLIKNNKTAVFLLEVGSRYLARIRAVNEAGESDYAYLIITDGVKTGSSSDTVTLKDSSTVSVADKIYYEVKDGTDTVAVSAIDTTNANIASSSTTMNAFKSVSESGSVVADVYTVNRYRIQYVLGAGTFKGAYNSTTKEYAALADATTPKTVLYATQMIKPDTTLSVVGETLLIPDGNVKGNATGSGTTYVSNTDATVDGGTLNLIADGQKFSKWLVTSEDDSGANTPTGNRYPTTAKYWDSTATDWTTTAPASLQGAIIRNDPNAYTGHTNLTLFANYALDTKATVTIVDYTAFEWKGYGDIYTYSDDKNYDTATTITTTTSDSNLNTTTGKYTIHYDSAGTDATEEVEATLVQKSDVSLTGTDTSDDVYYFTSSTIYDDDSSNAVYCTKDTYVTVSSSKTPTITLTLNTTTNKYDKVALKVRRSDSLVSKYYKEVTPTGTYTAATGTTPGSWSASPASWTLSVKGWRSGKYEVTVLGTSSKVPNKTYSFPIVIDLVD